ncbi:hypothetical protein P4H27_25080 [Paenibacillus taichungensis]|jgi:hypothetical protein|uniref:Uncharacterized protein n=2 Tax=Paenibacillus TaxID=44249 RepID=A0A855XQW7_9BACL|nr:MULTISPECIES: hypothetical protein [Paenibacillus]MDR9749384.1 hypothetical protein [Paenibacillus taichungensis]MEC0110246.1 hypothetical protein [Paenibacillus taichungensis]MEC0199319.1 hypothetical protein [Paenibacillus taichungensis]NEU61847.1 hypothetical protein [Paenibacillus sp. ALJ109b]NUU53222.1 hypothetical protein [Paenibacillus taichungensis]
MPTQRRLETDADFQEAMEMKHKVRVFKDNHQIDSGGVIIRFDSNTVVVQSSVSELAYHSRTACELFEIRK